MKKTSIILLALLTGAMTFSASARAAEEKDSTTQPTDQSAQNEKSAGDRADSVVKNLNIDDAAKATRVHDIIASELVAIHQWHQTNDARIKELGKDGGEELDKIQAQRHALHDGFIAKLSAELSLEQMEIVKEKLTGGQMMATYRNYPEIIPNLSDEEKAKILETLKEGREEAMDSANHKDRIAIFKKYKGRVNIYLDARGHHIAQAYKDWGKAQKAKQAAATEPAKDAGE
jgi:hypothetical protein